MYQDERRLYRCRSIVIYSSSETTSLAPSHLPHISSTSISSPSSPLLVPPHANPSCSGEREKKSHPLSPKSPLNGQSSTLIYRESSITTTTSTTMCTVHSTSPLNPLSRADHPHPPPATPRHPHSYTRKPSSSCSWQLAQARIYSRTRSKMQVL